MNECKSFETKDIVYAFQIRNEKYTLTPLLAQMNFPSNVNSFAIIVNMESDVNDSVFDHLIKHSNDFYEASMTRNQELMNGYIVINISMKEASDLAEKSDSGHFAYWNSDQLNIFSTHNLELIDVWNTHSLFN